MYASVMIFDIKIFALILSTYKSNGGNGLLNHVENTFYEVNNSLYVVPPFLNTPNPIYL